MTRDEHEKPAGSDESKPDERAVDAPRLTPQGRAAQGGEEATKPFGQGAKKGQSDKAEG
jgi:hypothetical protein